MVFLPDVLLIRFFLGWVGDGVWVFCPAYTPPLSVGCASDSLFLGLGWGWFLGILSCLPPRSVSGLVWAIGPLIWGPGHVSRVVGFAVGLLRGAVVNRTCRIHKNLYI